MGLREIKSARTRQRMIDVAVELFLNQGYDDTTMEQIAERAEVGTTTLYRYFPTKDLLLLDRIVGGMNLGERLRERPRDEPVGEALTAVLRRAAADFDAPELRLPEIRRLVDLAPVPRARLWDFHLSTRTQLEAALAPRMGRPENDLSVRLTAAFVVEVLVLGDERRRERDYATSASVSLEEVLAGLPGAEIVLPAVPAVSGPTTAPG
ncbi:TetR/AcrR family transcriptional regulator [Pseudonocardia sp. ICBG1293]|uniref:TetR/AcrR family transcriptional regulator n=1 Tax=Pseudonocardia sp. ICBG1293 TaxID=2844382 RepID=UPI001CCB1A49|nr:TetR/AcrR family transcriptional regulator [Pseudonocardia sp. ICBG1293]